MIVENNTPEGWMETTLGEVAHITMGQSPKSEFYNMDGKGLPFYQGVTEFNDKYVSIKKYTSKNTKVVSENSILFSVRAPVGRVNFTKKECCIGRGNAGLFMKNGNQNYLYFLLVYFERKFQDYTSGTVFTSISGKELNIVPITLPKKANEQKAIAKVLTAFDDKIELLQAQNKTLESMAQTIFKEWFGKYQIGDELPEGWRVGVYGDLVDLSSGKGVKKKEYIENGKYEIIGANGIIGRLNKFLVEERVIVTGRVGTLGTVFILNHPCWISDNVLISKPLIDNSFYFSYFKLKSFNFSSLNTGSTQPLITQGDLKSIEIIIPNKSFLKEFEKVSTSFFEKIKNNNSQIQFLTKTRDTLLPKLMSGQVRVKNLKQTTDA